MQKSGLLASAGAVLFVAAGVAEHAKAVNLAEEIRDFGRIDQNSSGIANGQFASGPTAAYDSLMYVKNWRGPSYDLTGTTATNTINSLAALMGGLPVPGGNAMAQGMQSWIDSQGLTDRFAVHQLGDSTPLDHTSVQNFITQAFSDNDAIQIGVAWSDTNGTLLTGTNTGSHILTLWGINTDGFSPHPLYGIDPWNNAILTFQIGQGPHGYFIVNYSNDGGASGTGGADGPDPDNPGHAVNGVVTFLTAEQALPEPASAGMGIMFVAAMGLARRRR